MSMSCRDDVFEVDEIERERWREDPVWFVRHRLGATPWRKQRELLGALRDHDYVAVRSCNGSGKTYIAAHAVIWWLLCYDDAVVITTAPTSRQVSGLLWREIRTIHAANRKLIGGRISATSLELAPRRFAFGFSTDSAERFQGFHQGHILFVVDEASGVEAKIFEAIDGSMTSRHSKLLLVGNPNSLSGVFYDAFHKDRGLWHTIHISAFDTPELTGERLGSIDEGLKPAPARRNGATLRPNNGCCTDTPDESASELLVTSPHAASLDPGFRRNDETVPAGLITRDWVERAARRWGRNSAPYQVRVLGEFPSQATDTLIPLIQIESAVGRDFGDLSSLEAVMGLDVARFGDDRSVACVRRGPEVIELSVFPSSDVMTTAGRALNLAREHSVRQIHVDEVGLGAGLLDRLREIGEIEAIGVNGGSKARKPERYLNLRAEMFDGLKDRFRDGDISICDDAELISELASLKYSFTSKGQMRLEDKQALRASGRPSPDKADAVMLAFAVVRRNPLMIW